MLPAHQELLRNAAAKSDSQVNSGAVVTVVAPDKQRVYALGIECDYSPGVAGIVAVQFAYATTTLFFRWDFSLGPFRFTFPSPLKSPEGNAAGSATCVLVLPPGGVGVTGTATLFYVTR